MSHQTIKRFLIGIGLVFPLFLAFLLVRWIFVDLPVIDQNALAGASPSLRIEDRNGQLLYESLSSQSERHVNLPLDQIPPAVKNATIATEDRDFYTNPGIDWRGILRAVWINLTGGETISGGSTITQQVARNLLLSQDERNQRSLQRKLRETILAWQITRKYSKEEILALYLNNIYYGSFAYGIEAAAQTYFGKAAAELDLAESALLAGLPQSPAVYNPYIDLQVATQRQVVVLGLMEKAGFISTIEKKNAEKEPLHLAEDPFPLEAPHFVMMVRNRIDALIANGQLPADFYRQDGVIIRTSLDLNWQRLAEASITKHLQELRASNSGFGHNVNNAALVALSPQSGEIVALAGSPDYFDPANNGAVNMAISPRQPGSALKPLVYADAMDPAYPHPITAGTIIQDVRTTFTTLNNKSYTPANYDGLEHGAVTAREALASSLNIPAVIVLDHIGLERFSAFASRLGVRSLGNPKDYDLSVALGGGGVTLLELSSAYGAFASGGFKVNPVIILKIYDRSGYVYYQAAPLEKNRVLDTKVAWLISDILSDDQARMIGFGLNSMLKLDRPAAVKTGTTTNFHDNWTVGYTPNLVVGVWVGNTNYEPMQNVTGLTGAAPIWHQFMRDVLNDRPVEYFSRPAGLNQEEICAENGLPPTPACGYRFLEWFIAGTTPQSNPSTASISASSTSIFPLSSTPPLRIASPGNNSRFILSESVPLQEQKLLIEIASDHSFKSITLLIDGSPFATFPGNPDPECWWNLVPGKHTIQVEGFRLDGTSFTTNTIQFVVDPALR